MANCQPYFFGTNVCFSYHHRCVTHLYGNNSIRRITNGKGYIILIFKNPLHQNSIVFIFIFPHFSHLTFTQFSALSACPVKLINTSSRFACFTSLGRSKPVATSLSINLSGVSIAIIFPASIIATRSHNTSASSM